MPGFQEFVFPFGGNTNLNYSGNALPAYAQLANGQQQAMSNLYNSGSQAFTGYGQGLAGQSGAQAQNFGAYAGALGNLAQNYTNQASARYGANAMAEAARQGAAGNIGSAALGAFGNLGGQAMQAWAANQAAYNKALSDMTSANQYATSQLGQSRNAALSGLGGAYSQAAAGLSPATLAGDISFNFADGGGSGFGGGGFSATGPDGGIGSGSYGGSGGGGGMTFTGSKKTTPGNVQQIVDRTYGGLGDVLKSINDDRYGGSLNTNFDRGMNSLDSQHASSREMPGQMMNQGLSGLMQLGRQAYGNSNRGMDQFYNAQDTAGGGESYSALASLLASQLGGGYRDSADRISDNSSKLTGGWKDNRAQFDATMANLGTMASQAGGGSNPLQSRLNDLRDRMATNMMYGDPNNLSYLEQQSRDRLQRGIDYLSGLTSSSSPSYVTPKYA